MNFYQILTGNTFNRYGWDLDGDVCTFTNNGKSMIFPSVKDEGQLVLLTMGLQMYHGNEMHIQDAFPQLSADEREFIKTGLTPDDWDLLFPEEKYA